MSTSSDDDAEWLELSGDLDPHAVELLRLELRRLARRHGVDVADFRVEPEPPDPSS